MRACADSKESTPQQGGMHVSEQSPSGVGAPEHPTADLSAREQQSADPGAEAPTRAFAGFRTARRGARPAATPAPAGMPPWDSTPVTGIPRVDPTAYGAYYNGRAEAPPP